MTVIAFLFSGQFAHAKVTDEMVEANDLTYQLEAAGLTKPSDHAAVSNILELHFYDRAKDEKRAAKKAKVKADVQKVIGN